MSAPRRHDSVGEGMWMAAIVAGIIAWLSYRAAAELPAVAAWWKLYNRTFVEWLPGYCKPTRGAAAVTLGACLFLPLLFAGIRVSEWLYITSLKSQKRRAQRIAALVDGRKPPVAASTARTNTVRAGSIEGAHEVFRRSKRKR